MRARSFAICPEGEASRGRDWSVLDRWDGSERDTSAEAMKMPRTDVGELKRCEFLSPISGPLSLSDKM